MREDYGKFPELVRFIRFLATASLGVTYDDIMQQFEWTRKTTERNLNFVRSNYSDDFEEFYDTQNRRIKRFKLGIPEKFGVDTVVDADITALAVAIKHIKNKDISESLRTLQFKLMQKMQYRTSAAQQNDLEGKMTSVNAISAPEPKLKANTEMVQEIEKAILAGHKISMIYPGKREERLLCPLGVVYGPINNYLIATKYIDSDNYKPCVYILDKIEKLTETKQHFNSRNFNLQDYVDKSFGAFHSPHGPYNVVWHVLPDAVAEAQRFSFHKTQKNIPNDDGSLTITMRADGLYEMAIYLFGWAGKIIPIAPTELVDIYKGIIRDARAGIDTHKK